METHMYCVHTANGGLSYLPTIPTGKDMTNTPVNLYLIYSSGSELFFFPAPMK